MNPVPVRVTRVPAPPLAGVKPPMIGAAVKLELLKTVPPGVVTVSGPFPTPIGATAVRQVGLTTVKLVAAKL